MGVPMRKTGVGVVATQSFVNPSYGTEGIELMENGNSATEALEILTSGEDGRDVRQVAIADANGNVAACTGKMCIPYAGHIMGENFSVQANMMLTEAVPAAMAEAFNRNTQLPFAERVLSVLFAAQEAGGDIRGKQ